MSIQSRSRQRNKMLLYLADAIRGAAASLNAAEHLICKEAGLSVEQWRGLSAIGRTTRFLSVSQLARVLNHSRQSTYELVLGLERAGWIRLLRNPDDRRLLQMEIAPAGRRTLSIVDARRSEWLVTMTYDLGESDLYTLTDRTRALRNRITRARTYT